MLGGAAAALVRDDVGGAELLFDEVTDPLTFTLVAISAAAQLSATPELTWWAGEEGVLSLLLAEDAPICRRLLAEAVAARLDLDYQGSLERVIDAFGAGDPVVEVTELFASLVEALAAVTDSSIDAVAIEVCLAFARA